MSISASSKEDAEKFEEDFRVTGRAKIQEIWHVRLLAISDLQEHFLIRNCKR